MIKLINLIDKAQAAVYLCKLQGKDTIKIFQWLQSNSLGFSHDEFETLWKIVIQIFDNTFGLNNRFREHGESRLDMFDSRATQQEVEQFLSAFKTKVDNIKAFF